MGLMRGVFSEGWKGKRKVKAERGECGGDVWKVRDGL